MKVRSLLLPSLTSLATRLQSIFPVVSCLGVALAPVASAALQNLQNADLAIILPAQKNLRIAASDLAVPSREAFLPADLLRQVEEAYKNSSVGDAVSTENSYEDWTLVSARVVPCAPLGVIPGTEANVLCWPEVRLVWQPIIKDFRRYAAILSWFADDRAIHALYDVHAKVALQGESGIRAQQLLNKVRSALERNPTQASKLLAAEELSEFITARNLVARALMEKTLSLRSKNIDSRQYEKITERPEFNEPQEAKEFVARLKIFISETTSRAALKEMTSFSLPEGREPPQSDEWVFLKYLRENGKMVQVDITVQSAIDGRELINMGKNPKASQMRDDPDLHTALETLPAADADELKKRVLLSPQELSSKSEIINDRALGLVPNTTCGSCHKFNSLRFDFHNLSYLEDRTVSVSPRVHFDVLRDLEWLEQEKLK
ncbi:MAG: hypothetical protein FJY29_01870 [Betaproteobacteria bacterium]|nr:hypothetical protein [Betaproteobacteria bacterium]